MKFTTLISNIFYADVNAGLELFVDCLGFTIIYDDLKSQEHPFCVIAKDGLKAYLIQDEEFAAKDRPELRIETRDIDDVYKQVCDSHPHLLHPNGREVKLKQWNAKEFSLLDSSGVCIIVQEWQ